MQMKYRLTAILPFVQCDPESLISKMIFPGDVSCQDKHFAQKRHIGIFDTRQMGDVFFGNDKNVGWCLWIYIMEGNQIAVFLLIFKSSVNSVMLQR
jgi:hypothetical protein